MILVVFEASVSTIQCERCRKIFVMVDTSFQGDNIIQRPLASQRQVIVNNDGVAGSLIISLRVRRLLGRCATSLVIRC